MTVASPSTVTINPANPYDTVLQQMADHLRDTDIYPEQTFSGSLADLVKAMGASTMCSPQLLNRIRHGLVYALGHPRIRELFGLEVIQRNVVNGEHVLTIRAA